MQFFRKIFKHKRNPAVPICIFVHHKVGTVLLSKVFGDICREFGWKFKALPGKQYQLPRDIDVALFSHSQIDPNEIETPYVGLHVIRDPRDIIVSGYQYHRRTTEKWCTNSDVTPESPINFPKVPFSQQHRTEDWKAKYLESLNGMSYQDNLLNMSRTDGLLFELQNYGSWTLEGINNWNYDNENILEIKIEDLISDYDKNFLHVFEHLQISKPEIAICMKIASHHNLKNMSDSEVEKVKHVSSRNPSRWKEYFEDIHKQAFLDKFGDTLIELGYEKNNHW